LLYRRFVPLRKVAGMPGAVASHRRPGVLRALPLVAVLTACSLGADEQVDPVAAGLSSRTPAASALTGSLPPTATPSVTRTAGATSPSPTITPSEPAVASDERRLRPQRTITGDISPKSVVASGDGLFFAQNMMYRHTITVYNRAGRLVRTIDDRVDLADFNLDGGQVQGAPVEAAFSPDSRYAYVSNYSLYGSGYNNQGADSCSPGSGYDESVVYRIDTETLDIDDVIPVGSVPKYLAVSPDGRRLVVSNWCSYSVSVIDTDTGRVLEEIEVGAYPRGVAIDPASRTAYIAVMGSRHIAALDLRSYRVRTMPDVGTAPRHLVLDPSGRFLYVTLNGDGTVAKVRVRTGEVVARTATGGAPRSMVMAPDGRSLYVVNYESASVSKLRARDLELLQTVPTAPSPIGITYDAERHNLWVACYGGSILIFKDRLA
jgi:YVTN family beta-propeller protein